MSQSAVIENDELGQRERMTRRKQLYWGILWGNVGIRIPFSQFRAAGKAVYNEHIGEAAVQNTLAAMRREPCPMPGGVLTVGQKHAQLDRTEMVLDEREEHRPQVKYLIGAALWTILTGVSPLEKRAEEKLEIVHHDWERVQKKIDALRLKALITMLIDAGSTTFFVAQQFNRYESIPLRVKAGDRQSLIRLNFISNSVKIIEELRNGRHRSEIGLTVVGGEIRRDRGSVCGKSAEVFLNECATGGDVAVIGTTGYGGINGGTYSFFSDNLEESCLKTDFLQRAWLRGLAFDSSKLAPKMSTRIFADLSPEAIDFVITDDGYEKDGDESYESHVKTFCNQANRCGVPVAIVKTKGA